MKWMPSVKEKWKVDDSKETVRAARKMELPSTEMVNRGCKYRRGTGGADGVEGSGQHSRI